MDREKLDRDLRALVPWRERLGSWWSHRLCRWLGHKRPSVRRLNCETCPRCCEVIKHHDDYMKVAIPPAAPASSAPSGRRDAHPGPATPRSLVLLPLDSRILLPRRAPACVTTLPREAPFRLLDLVVRDPRDWQVEDASSGHRSWHPGGALDAAELSGHLRSGKIAGPVVRTAQDFSVRVEYAGELPEAPLIAAALGYGTRELPRLGEARCRRRAMSEAPAEPGTPAVAVLDLGLDPIAVSTAGGPAAPGPTARASRRIVVTSVRIRDEDDWIVEDLLLDGVRVADGPGRFPARALAVACELGLVAGCVGRRVEVRATRAETSPARGHLEVDVELAPVRDA